MLFCFFRITGSPLVPFLLKTKPPGFAARGLHQCYFLIIWCSCLKQVCDIDWIVLLCILDPFCVFFLYCTYIVVVLIWVGSSWWLQISMLTKKNKILSQKCKGSLKDGTQLSKKASGKDVKLQSTKLAKEIVADSLSSQSEVGVICSWLISSLKLSAKGD